MQMYSADIFISTTAFFVAENEPEARQMSDEAKETALSILQDEFFTDRNFDDPLLADLTFATTFTYWMLIGHRPLVDRGPVEAFLRPDRKAGVGRQYRLFSGNVMVGATVYIKAGRRSEAETTFKALEQTSFKFSTNVNGIALLGLNELTGIFFEDRFTCHILDQSKLNYRGSCAPFRGRSDGHQAKGQPH